MCMQAKTQSERALGTSSLCSLPVSSGDEHKAKASTVFACNKAETRQEALLTLQHVVHTAAQVPCMNQAVQTCIWKHLAPSILAGHLFSPPELTLPATETPDQHIVAGTATYSTISAKT